MENPEMGGPVGGAGRPGPVVELNEGGVENWDMEVLKAEGATGGGAGVRGGAIVETVAEGTSGTEAEVIIGRGSGDTPAGKGGEYAGDDTLGVARGLDKANETGVAAAVAAPAVLGGGVPGGVVSIPLSSIIFLQLQKAGRPRVRSSGSCGRGRAVPLLARRAPRGARSMPPKWRQRTARRLFCHVRGRPRGGAAVRRGGGRRAGQRSLPDAGCSRSGGARPRFPRHIWALSQADACAAHRLRGYREFLCRLSLARG